MKRNLMGGGVDISLPNVSYCEDVKDVHYLPYNLVRFYVGEVTPPQTVKIYTDLRTSVDIEVSEGNKWYSYVLPKDKGLYQIEGDSVKKVVVKADIVSDDNIIPHLTVEASFKGSNTSNVTNMSNMFSSCSKLTSLDLSDFDTSNVIAMNSMFQNCTSLTSLDLKNFNTSNVDDMDDMFNGCSGLTSLDLSGWGMRSVTCSNDMFKNCTALTTIRMVGCIPSTIDKIKAVKPSSATIVTE